MFFSLIYIFHLCHFGLFNLCFCFVDFFSHSPTTPPHYQCRSISIRQVLYSIIHQRSHHHCITSSHPISSRPCCTRHKYLYRLKKYFSLCKSLLIYRPRGMLRMCKTNRERMGWWVRRRLRFLSSKDFSFKYF